MLIVVRADGAGYSHDLISAMAAQGLDFSVGYPVTEAVRAAIMAVPERLRGHRQARSATMNGVRAHRPPTASCAGR